MIDVKLQNECPPLPDMIKRSCLVCGSTKGWVKITLIRGVGLQGTSIALCRRCARELADKIDNKTGGMMS